MNPTTNKSVYTLNLVLALAAALSTKGQGASAGDLSGSIALPESITLEESVSDSQTINLNSPLRDFKKGPGRGPHGKGPKLTNEQKAALDACLLGKGITPPTPPTGGQVWTTPPPPPSDTNREAFQACQVQVLGSSGKGPDHSAKNQAMDACLNQYGISPPQLSNEQRAALQTCRAQNPSLIGDSLDMCILAQGVALPELSALAQQAVSTCKAQVFSQ